MSSSFSLSSTSKHAANGSGGGCSSTSHRASDVVVRFALDDEMCQTHPVRRLDSYTKEERSQIWFTRDDYKVMNEETKAVLDSMENGSSTNNAQYYFYTRGLENKTHAGSVKKKMASLDGICAVLVEQERQSKLRIVDENQISKVYRQATAANVREAMERGGYDAQQALHALNRCSTSSAGSGEEKYGEDNSLSLSEPDFTPLTKLWVMAKAKNLNSNSTNINKSTSNSSLSKLIVGTGGAADWSFSSAELDFEQPQGHDQQQSKQQQQHQSPKYQFVGARERIRSFFLNRSHSGSRGTSTTTTAPTTTTTTARTPRGRSSTSISYNATNLR